MNQKAPKGEEKESLEEKLILQQIEQNKDEAEELLKNKDKMERFLERLEKKLSRIPFAGKYLSDVPILISLVKAYVEKTYLEIPIGSIIAIVCALIYFLSPIDLIPDFIPGIGIVDDLAVIAFVLKLIHDDLMEYKAWRDKCKQF